MTINNSSSSAMEPTNQVHVEPYSLVLSATVLVLAAVLGGGGSLTILLALFRNRSVRQYSYTLLLAFFCVCAAMDAVWSPLELLHLLVYRHSLSNNPAADVGVAAFAVYVFVCTGIGVLITALSVENVLRCFRHFRACRVWPVAVCTATFLISLFMTLAFLYPSLNSLQQEGTSGYFVLDSPSSVARVSILSVVAVLVAVALVVMMVAEMAMGKKMEMKNSDSYMSSGYNNDAHPQLPLFLLKQAGAAGAGSCEDAGKDSPSLSSLTRLPEAAENDALPAMPFKGRNSPKGGDLGDSGLRGSPMLGVNMAQVLGRRRHTICQIGDSGPSPDPIPKPKQYNYVRKFSVDISALQAQLSNPKLFKDKAPFQSDQDLTQRPRSPPDRPAPTRPLLPLGDLGGNAPKLPRSPQLPLKELGSSETTDKDSGNQKLPLLPPRPPVITVSEDVKEEEKEEEEEEEEEENDDKEDKEEGSGFNSVPKLQYSSITNKDELTTIPKLPITQPVDEEDEEEEDEDGWQEDRKLGNSHHFQGGEDASTDLGPNEYHLNVRDRDFFKLTLVMAVTFLLCTLPLLVVEAMKERLHMQTYLNVSTCLRALSSIQTIVYPHLVLCLDQVMSQAVQRIKDSLCRGCGCGCGCRACLLLFSERSRGVPAATHV